MEIDYSENALTDLAHWKQKGTETVRKRIQNLIENIAQTPFSGIGKPEPLKHSLSGKWPRQIDQKNRIIYTVANDRVRVYSMRGHYLDR